MGTAARKRSALLRLPWDEGYIVLPHERGSNLPLPADLLPHPKSRTGEAGMLFRSREIKG